MLKNDYSNAFNYLKEAQQIMEKTKLYFNLSVLYKDISSFYELQNQLDSALFYSKESQSLIQQLQSNTIAIETHQKYITSMLEASQKDLVIAKQKNELKNRMRY